MREEVKGMTNQQYYYQIDIALKDYEQHKPYKRFSIDWICNRIDWCWKFKHLTKEQMESLSNRICEVMNNERWVKY